MSPTEFRHWLQGFRDAGGTDIDVILAKAQEIEAEVKFVPTQPARPYTAPNTGDPPPWRVGEITCSRIASGASIQDDHWPAWPRLSQ